VSFSSITENNDLPPVQIQVSHHDGSAARNVRVTVKLLNTAVVVSGGGNGRMTINMPADRRPQTITVSGTAFTLLTEPLSSELEESNVVKR